MNENLWGKKRMGGKVGYCPGRDVREGAREQPRYCTTSRVQGFEGDEVMLSPLLVSSEWYLPQRPRRSVPVLRSQNQRPGGKRRVTAAGKMRRNTNCQGQPLASQEEWTSARCFASLGAALSFLQHCFHLGQSLSVYPNSSGKHGKYLQRNILSSGMKSKGICKSQLMCVSFVYSLVPDSKLNNLCLPLTGFSFMEQHTWIIIELFPSQEFLLMKKFQSPSFFRSPSKRIKKAAQNYNELQRQIHKILLLFFIFV